MSKTEQSLASGNLSVHGVVVGKGTVRWLHGWGVLGVLGFVRQSWVRRVRRGERGAGARLSAGRREWAGEPRR